MRNMNQELMKQVERIVRPLLATKSHKMRMREELYTHLEHIYLEEMNNHQEESLALEKAIQRLGEQEKLSHGLQRTVTKREQFLMRYNSLFARKQTESRFQFATRMGLGIGFLDFILFMLVIAAGSFVFHDKDISSITSLLCLFSLIMGWNTFWGIYLSQPHFELTSINAKPNRSFTLSGFCFGLSVGVSEALMWLSIPGEFENMTLTVLGVVLPILAGWGMFCLVVWLFRLEISQTAPWELLQLGD